MDSEVKQELGPVAKKLLMSRLVAASSIFTVLIFIVICNVVEFAGADRQSAELVPIVCGVVGVWCLVIAEFIPALFALLYRNKTESDLQSLLNRNFIIFICETVNREAAALVGVVIFIVSPDSQNISYALWGLAIAMMIVRFPGEKKMTRGIGAELLR